MEDDGYLGDTELEAAGSASQGRTRKTHTRVVETVENSEIGSAIGPPNSNSIDWQLSHLPADDSRSRRSGCHRAVSIELGTPFGAGHHSDARLVDKHDLASTAGSS